MPCCVCLPTTCSESRSFSHFLGGLAVAGQIEAPFSCGQLKKNSGGGEATLVLTIFLLPSSRRATPVETPVEGAPTPLGSPLPTPATVVARCPGWVSMVGAWCPAGNARVGLRQISSWRRCCPGRGGALVSFSVPTTTFNPSVRCGTTGVVWLTQYELALVVVGAWCPASNAAPRVGLRQFSPGRYCTGRGGALVSFNTSTSAFNMSVTRGMLGGDGVC